MSIIKLKNAGEEITLEIAAVEIVPSQDPKMGAQVKFDTPSGDTLYVGESAVERQLDRCGVATIEELAGQTIHFSRAANKNPAFPPYWNLDRAREGDKVAKPTNGNGAAKATAPKAPAVPYSSPGLLPGENPKFDDLINSYGECLVAANSEIAPVLKKAGYEVTAETLTSVAATLFIQRTRANV
jgi:hypothetical protein